MAGPTNLRATVTGALVTLAWNLTPGSTGQSVEVGSSAGLANLAILNVGAVTTVSASAPSGRYFVRVRGSDACGPGAASNEIIVDVP